MILCKYITLNYDLMTTSSQVKETENFIKCLKRLKKGI